jgi:hypothetical protein
MSGVNGIFRTPGSQDYKHQKVEDRPQHKQKQSKEDEQKKKKRDPKMDNMFSSLADNLSAFGGDA